MIALWILFMRYVDLFMLVTPEFGSDGGNLHMLARRAREPLLRALARPRRAARDRRAVDVDVRDAAAAASDAGVQGSLPARSASKLRRPLMAHHPASTARPTTNTRRRRKARPTSTPTPPSAPVAKFLIWLFVAAVLTHVGLAGVYKLLIDQGVAQEAGERRYPLAATEDTARCRRLPRLQQHPPQELRDVPRRGSDAARVLRLGEQGGGHGPHSDRRGDAPHRRARAAGAGGRPGADRRARHDAGRFELGPDAGAAETVARQCPGRVRVRGDDDRRGDVCLGAAELPARATSATPAIPTEHEGPPPRCPAS